MPRSYADMTDQELWAEMANQQNIQIHVATTPKAKQRCDKVIRLIYREFNRRGGPSVSMGEALLATYCAEDSDA